MQYDGLSVKVCWSGHSEPGTRRDSRLTIGGCPSHLATLDVNVMWCGTVPTGSIISPFSDWNAQELAHGVVPWFRYELVWLIAEAHV